jgi:hypothetical protein
LVAALIASDWVGCCCGNAAGIELLSSSVVQRRALWCTQHCDAVMEAPADPKTVYENARKELIAALQKKRAVDKTLVRSRLLLHYLLLLSLRYPNPDYHHSFAPYLLHIQ